MSARPVEAEAVVASAEKAFRASHGEPQQWPAETFEEHEHVVAARLARQAGGAR